MSYSNNLRATGVSVKHPFHCSLLLSDDDLQNKNLENLKLELVGTS